jgi:PAS domain-containing protein
MPFFICPNCKQRSLDHDGLEGISERAVSCGRCGFGFLFELLDDYYPGPNTGFVVCDQSRRIIASGRGVFELTGYQEEDVLGRDLIEALGLHGFEPEQDPAGVVLEWGVRQLGEQLAVRTRSGSEKPVTADFFPGYDEDGGLLVALAPR